MAKRLFCSCMQLLVLIVLVASCSASDEQNLEVPQLTSDAVAEGESVDLYGAEMDDDELRELIPMSMVDLTEMSAMTSSGRPGSEIKEEPGAWKEPEHKMNLVRFFNGRYYSGQYNKINDLLVREIETPDVDSNMALLNQWLDRERQKGVGLFNKGFVEALQQLTDLYTIKNKKDCTRDAYSIIFKNDQATGGRAHKPLSKLQPLRRVDALVYQLFVNHAIECYHEYPENYARVRESMDQNVKRLVETFIDSVLGDPIAVTSKVKGLGKKAVAPLAYNFLRVNALDDKLSHYLGKVIDERNGKLFVDEQKVRLLVNKYILQPCKDYNQAMGPDVFLPARFDVKMLMHEDRYQPDSRLLNEFLHSYIHFSLCEKLIKRDEPYLTNNLVRHINSLF